MPEKPSWVPVREATIDTEEYRYIIGVYDHKEHGRCFRLLQFHQKSGLTQYLEVPDSDQEVLSAIVDAACWADSD